MSGLPPQLYAAWRAWNFAPLTLEEPGQSQLPAERLLQAVWHHQRLRRDRLRTLDGQAVQVLHPGFHNHEAGPDFREAVLQFQGEAPVTGDIEVDLQTSHWQAHRHEHNPAYKKVLLHVVWEASAPGLPHLRTLALQPYLDAPLDQLQQWLGTDAANGWPPQIAGQCCAYLRALEAPLLAELLRQAAGIRLRAKAAQFEARARQAGWETALWEGLFRALGYKHNPWSMQCIGELLPRLKQAATGGPTDVLSWQARLLGVAGLLPVETPHSDSETGEYWRKIWAHWWRERDALWDCLLPRKVWRWQGLRPANHPQRRLALVAHWLVRPDFMSRLESWLTDAISDPQWFSALHEFLQPAPDDFWTRHWTLQSGPSPRPVPLLGEKRVADLAVNAVLPWLWARAAAGKNGAAQPLAERRYFAWPKADDNTLLKLARQRLLGDGSARRLHGAAEQQGLLQIVRDFCDHSNALCLECPFPRLLRQLGG